MATAVIIVTYCNNMDITECLEAISDQAGTGDLGVFVVENGGPAAFDALAEALAAPGGPCSEAAASKLANLASPGGCHLRCVELVTCRGHRPVAVAEAPENLGYGGGINSWLARLMPYLEWDGFWILNPDTMPESIALSALKAAFPVIGNPANRKRAVMLTAAQFRFAFTNAVDDEEAARLYETYPVPGLGIPLFQAALANLNPRTEASVDSKNPARGPMKFISGEKDHTVPWAIANASFKRQRRNTAVTEIEELPGRGHSLVIDTGWQEVAQVALDFIERHRPT